MKVLITGAGGFIGTNLALKLASSGVQVRALYRSKYNEWIKHNNIELVKGDIMDTGSLENAIAGCSQIYHLAAHASNWARNPKVFYDVNITGTDNIIEIAAKHNVEKIVVTSTAGTLGPSQNGTPVTESSHRTVNFFSDYESSKFISEEKILRYVKKGHNIVLVNPTRVFGPGVLSKSNTVTKIIYKYINGKWKFKLGKGKEVGNYVFIDDIVSGHILAMDKGVPGERYILGGDNVTFEQFIAVLAEVNGKKHRLIKVPLWLLITYTHIEDFMANQFGVTPIITHSWVRKYMANWTVSSEKAEKELGYRRTPLKTGIEKTIDWIKKTPTAYFSK